MQVRPISPERLAELLADRITALPGAGERWLRVAVDGAAAARPGDLADALVEPLRLRGLPALRVSAGGFLRPASIRLEYGKQDPDAFHGLWLDDGALLREVLDPLEPGGTGRVLPSLRDPVTDRATRAPYTQLPPGGVLLLDGALLLGRWLPLDLAVHLALTPAALARRTPPDEQWTLPAFARYEAETVPAESADLTIRADDPRHPALVEHD
ncbi:uridine kinase [Kitasatospora aureofaciens]|uniref:uridine kinase n=1 Tax=Kitasatospora aureofaciens TaxID=1894 RepID=UPI001C4630DB|nr:uridine kinase [Kitasatospora aureofaciens]MBV6697706.1 uridine kinase [Kitasatospora aureofaciens]